MDEHTAGWLAGQAASIGALIVAFAGWFTPLVAIVPLVYYSLLIYEHPVVKRWMAAWRKRQIARAKARLFLLEVAQKTADDLAGSDRG